MSDDAEVDVRPKVVTSAQERRAPSLRDVASHAGVSVSTVSRYLIGQLRLRPETETRVELAISELGYERAARSGAEARGGATSIGLIVPEIANAYFGRIAEGVIESANRCGLSVLLASTQSHAGNEAAYSELLASIGIGGLVYVGSHVSNPALAELVVAGLPVVAVDEEVAGVSPCDSVRPDDYAGAYQATKYLVTLGHRQIALVTGPDELRSVRDRRCGYEDAMANAGLAVCGPLLSGPFSAEFGAAALSRLMSSRPAPTAVFAASDEIALGILLSASTFGLSLPVDLSLVGFDDVPAAAIVAPRLTTVRTPVATMARMAVDMLTERMAGRSLPSRSKVAPVSLVERDSTAPR